MRKKLLLFSFLLASAMMAVAGNVVTIRGEVPRYEGTGYLLLIKDGVMDFDTISVQADGTFEHQTLVEAPTNAKLYLEYLNDDRGLVSLYLMPGKPLKVSVSGNRGKIRLFESDVPQYILTAKFKGATSRECDYLNTPKYFACYATDKNGQRTTYRQFLGQVKDRQALLYSKLKGTSQAFRDAHTQEIDDLLPSLRFRYDWVMESGGLDAWEDDDFKAYVNGIDVNRNITADHEGKKTQDEIFSKVMYDIDRLYDKNDPLTLRFLTYLRDHINNKHNQEVLADEIMTSAMTSGGGDRLCESWQIYSRLSGRSESFKKNERLYATLSQLGPGTEAADFEMQDTEGRTVRFWDVIKRGKITYIDFWATWCGPCCAEIPFVEKLVEKYKGNEKIQFVSISLDDKLDKWHEKLNRDKPTWEQYVIPENFDSKFAREYNIRAIPRFMVFDGKGRIISTNANRPSSPEIENTLNQLIQ